MTSEEWDVVVDNAQRAIENAAKTVIALTDPVPHTHSPGPLLRELQSLTREVRPQILRLAELADAYDTQTHIRVGYGDDKTFRAPWDLFTQEDAEKTISMATEAVNIAQDLFQDSERRKDRESDQEKENE